MKIIHNTNSKYVPNQLFNNQLQQIDEYKTYKKENKKNTNIIKQHSNIIKRHPNIIIKQNSDIIVKQNSDIIIKQNSDIIFEQNSNIVKQTLDKNKLLFQEREIRNKQIEQCLKQQQKQRNQSMLILDIKENDKENIFQQSNDIQLIEQGTLEKDNKKKYKKKISPKKNNLRKILLEDFNSNTQIDNIHSIQSKSNKQIQNLEQNLQSIQIQQNNLQVQAHIQSANRRFNLLYNDLNFDSSDEQEDYQKKQSSEENQYQKICFEFTKPKNHLFIDDDQFEDSSNQNSQEKSEKEQDSLKQSSTQSLSKYQPKEKVYLTTTEFRRNYVVSGEEYLKKPIPQNKFIQFILKRDKSKNKSNYIQYYLYDSRVIKQLLYIRKSNKLEIYAKENVQNPRAHPDLKYLTAQIETNFLGNEFSLKYLKKNTNQKTNAESICYEMNLLGMNGPRKMNIYIPEEQNNQIQNSDNLETLHQNKKEGIQISKFINKQAKWNNEVQSYVLNMKGKAKVSSVKNFVIVRDIEGLSKKEQQKEEQKSYVIFGKVERDLFNLVVGGPFSILQGLTIALSTFDRKFACE